MNWIRRFLDWLFPWRGNKKIHKSIDHLEGLVVDLQRGTTTVTNRMMDNGEKLEEKERKFEEYKDKLKKEDEVLQKDATTAASVITEIRKIQEAVSEMDGKRTEYPST